jgi:hypothetical protein
MWVLAEYLPTTLFSLRPATATTSGGKSLIVPTPFAIKMALLDAAIRTQGLAAARAAFPAIRAVQIAIRPPAQIVINSTFMKILRLKEIKTKASEKSAAIEEAQANHQWPFQKTIAYREYVQFGGPLALAFLGMSLEELSPLLLQLSYLGKRGGFMQLRRPPIGAESRPGGYTDLTESPPDSFPLGVLQLMDDFGADMTFDHADIYNAKPIRLGKERVLRHIVLPYRMARSSRSFTLYERFDA